MIVAGSAGIDVEAVPEVLLPDLVIKNRFCQWRPADISKAYKKNLRFGHS
jgi:hypothetical protein